MWEDAFLGVAIAILIGTAFVGGCFCGSAVQRSIGYVIRTRVEKELLEQATDREEQNYEKRRAEDYRDRRNTYAEEASRNLYKRPENPMGPNIPSPDELDEIMGQQHDFTATMSTERMRQALEAGRG